MAKEQAFLFYPNDWIGGTLGMTFEEKGAYMELLVLQFNHGHMTKATIDHILGHMGGHMGGQESGSDWEKLKSKFIQDENGLWYNVRLDEEKKRRENYSNSRKNNLLGANQYSKKNTENTEKQGGHMGGHMGAWVTSHMGATRESNISIGNNNPVINSLIEGAAEISFPFQTEKFSGAWVQWKEYKSKEFKFKYKSPQSEQSALMNLNDLAEGDEHTAIKIILQSMAKGWKGFFKLQQENGQQTTKKSKYQR